MELHLVYTVYSSTGVYESRTLSSIYELLLLHSENLIALANVVPLERDLACAYLCLSN